MSTGDLRLAARALSRSRGFAVTAVLSFALAIALNTTIYSLLAALIDPQIDVRKPEQLYSLRFFGDYHHRLPRGALESALTSGVPGLTGISGTRIAGKAATVEHGQQEFDARVLNVRVNLFAVLGTRALEGRLFTEADAAAGAPVAIVSDGLVARLFPDGALPINATIAVDGQPYTVIGVVRRSTVLSELSADAWLLPSGADRTVPVNLIRLADGVDPKSVGSQLEVIAARLAVAAGDKPSEARLRIVGGATRQFRVGKFHWALAAGALAVLLVACSNLANLQFARGLARSSEMALRSALGATRGDLVALVMYEVALLAAGGLVLGLVLAYWGTRLIRATIPSTIAGYLVAPNVHWEMLGVAVAATLVCLVIVGLWPAWRIARADPSAMIQSRAGTGAHRHHRRRYAAMIVVQIALALPLLCGAALVSRSDWRLERSRFLVEQFFGYDPTPIVSGTVTIDADRGAQVPVANVASDLMSRMRAIHGVLDAVVIGSAKPLKWSVTIQDRYGYEREFPAPMWEARLVTPSYLRTLARPLVAGADFNEGAYTVPEVIMDEPTARYLWRGGDAVGRLIKFGDARSDAPWARVVGVFHDQMDTTTLRLRDPAFGRHLGSVYRTFTPSDTGVVGGLGLDMTVLARVQGDPHAIAVQMRHVLWTMPGIRSSYVLPLEDRWGITDQRTAERFVALIFAIFAVLGTVLAALGVYGIVSHSVTERRREFGVRISLGATTRHVLHDVLREGNVVVLLGIAGGLFFTKQPVMWLMPFLNGKDDMYDAPLFAAIAIALMATAWVAALVPALRATRIDPVDALRNE